MQNFLEPAILKAPRDYRNSSGGNKRELAIKFLFECSDKLGIKPLTVAAAATYFHRFQSEVEYDEFLIASASIYLATKVKDEPVKIRDLVSVVHCTLNRTVEPPENDGEFWVIRDAIVQAELLVARMLKFQMDTTHPHKFLLHYMKFLQDWFGETWRSMPIAKTAAGFLQDFHHSPDILQYEHPHIAICCLSLAFQIYGIQVPVRQCDQGIDPEQWYIPFVGDLSKDKHWAICEKILAVYDECNDGLPLHSTVSK